VLKLEARIPQEYTEETMTTQRNFEQPNPTLTAAVSPDDALNAKQQRVAELDDHALDRVIGGYPPSPCAPSLGHVAGSYPPNPC
jgi:hypothetical protein